MIARRFVHLIAALALAGPAAAQPAGEEGATASTPQEIRTLHEFARCVALRRTSDARAVLAMDFRGEAYRRVLARLSRRHPDCVEKGKLSTNGRFFAGRMAESLLLRDATAAEFPAKVAFNPQRPPLEARNSSELMSICVVRAAPEAVYSLFGANPATVEESAAVRALVPHIQSCLPENATGEFNRSGLRSMLALAAYRLLQHNQAALPPTGN